ncbi:MAG TPA: hypothetical protein VKE40_24435 [Gemmataceae bacterium]|nr:hypothetical protein [Gemmataceae bacterium]
MRVFAHHDSAGAIRAVVTVTGPKAMTAMVMPKPGLSVAEVEGLPIGGGPIDVAAVRRTVKGLKVPVSAPRPLVGGKG